MDESYNLLSPEATVKEKAARIIAEKDAPELCVALGNIISCIPPQGQTFGGANEWKPWCRLVEELKILANDPEMSVELEMLQQTSFRSIDAYNRTQRSKLFFIFFPLVSYLLALLYESARIQILVADHLDVFTASVALPLGHPARLTLTLDQLHNLIIYTQSQKATDALFALSGVSSLLDMDLQNSLRCLGGRRISFAHKREIVRLVYESGVENNDIYSGRFKDPVVTYLVTYFLDRERRRQQGSQETINIMPRFRIDDTCKYNASFVDLLIEEIVLSPTLEVWFDVVLATFPLAELTEDKYKNIVEPFLYRITGAVLSQPCSFALFRLVNTAASVCAARTSSVEGYIASCLLPALAGDYKAAACYLSAVNLHFIATQLSVSQRTELLRLVLKFPHREDLMIITERLVSLGANLSDVDVKSSTRYTAEFIRYFLDTRAALSVKALGCAQYALSAQDCVH